MRTLVYLFFWFSAHCNHVISTGKKKRVKEREGGRERREKREEDIEEREIDRRREGEIRI